MMYYKKNKNIISCQGIFFLIILYWRTTHEQFQYLFIINKLKKSYKSICPICFKKFENSIVRCPRGLLYYVFILSRIHHMTCLLKFSIDLYIKYRSNDEVFIVELAYNLPTDLRMFFIPKASEYIEYITTLIF